MLLKLVGAAMVGLSCMATARAITSVEKDKTRQLDAFISLVRYIRNRIDCYAIPIDKIFAECPEEILEPLGGREGAVGFDGILHRKNILIDGEARRTLDEFSEGLGKNYRERQIKLCDGAISALEAVRESEMKRYAAKKKTVNALCLAAGGMVVILLL